VDLDAPVTTRDFNAGREELRGEMHGIRDELRGEMRALEARLHLAIADSANRVLGVVATSSQQLEARLVQLLETRMLQFEANNGRQLATWANTIIDTLTDRMRAMGDQYRDLPGRVSRLERRVDRLEEED
jgi:hypothetical protein